MSCEYCGIAGHTIQGCKKTKCLKCGVSGHLYGNCQAPFCRWCKGYGHVLKKCPKYECKRCCEQGHLVKDCDKCAFCLQSDHTIGDCPNIICKRCKEKGHPDWKCETPQCEYCERFSHEQKDCPLYKCERCKEHGHLIGDCIKWYWGNDKLKYISEINARVTRMITVIMSADPKYTKYAMDIEKIQQEMMDTKIIYFLRDEFLEKLHEYEDRLKCTFINYFVDRWSEEPLQTITEYRSELISKCEVRLYGKINILMCRYSYLGDDPDYYLPKDDDKLITAAICLPLQVNLVELDEERQVLQKY